MDTKASFPSVRHHEDLWLLLSTVLMIIPAAIFRGGNRSLVLIAIEWLGMLVLLCVALKASKPASLDPWGSGMTKGAIWLAAGSPLLIAAIQLAPFPVPLSETPDETWLSALAAIPVVAAFLAALTLQFKDLVLVAKVWIGVAVAQALVGLLQLGSFEWLYFGNGVKTGVMGTFGNRNHFANLLMMAIPLVVMQLLTRRQSRRRHTGLKNDKATWYYRIALFLMLAGISASMSRSVIVLGVVVLLVSFLLMSIRNPDERLLVRGVLGVGAIILMVFLAGGTNWLERFDAISFGADARLRQLNRDLTWSAAMDSWPFGSGLGSFESVFPRYQDVWYSYYSIPYAHSDFLQFLMEVGILVALTVVPLAWLMARRTTHLVFAFRQQSEMGTKDSLAVACGISWCAMLLHSWVDFPFHIPVNAMLAAFVLGAFLREPEERAAPGRAA